MLFSLKNEGMDRDEALILASKRRMRPIFMTAIAMVLGMLPLAVKHGQALKFTTGLAMAVVGGLSVATLFTLVFIPVDLHDLRGCEGQLLENSAYHIGRHKRRHGAQSDLIRLLFTLHENDGWIRKLTLMA